MVLLATTATMTKGERVIERTRGNVVRADAEALVNTVNCVGVMGRGVALQFRKAFPENYRVYRAACDRKELHPGMMLVVPTLGAGNPKYIINFPTKRHWKGKSRIEDIDSGLRALIAEVRARGITSIAVPPLGCGLGGLHWSDVRPRIEQAFAALPGVEVQLFEPIGEPSVETLAREARAPRMTEGRAALLGLIRRYLAAVMDPIASLLEIHKLMYFMQATGEPLKLQYQKGTYGPYAENLRHVLSHIDGYFITGYGDGADRPDRQIELNLEASERAEAFLRDHPATHQRFDRVVDLIEGFETPFGMELLATVHWVVDREGATKSDEIVGAVHAWNDRKLMFDAQHIHLALKVLSSKGWIPTAPGA